MDITTHQPKLVLSVDINLCGLGLCFKEFNGAIKNWIMLYCAATNSREVYKALEGYTRDNNIQPDTIIMEEIYYSQIRNIADLLRAEGIARGVLASLFPNALIIMTPSKSYKTYFKITATGTHKGNKIAVVRFLNEPMKQWFGDFDEGDSRMHDMADCLLLIMFLERTWGR